MKKERESDDEEAFARSVLRSFGRREEVEEEKE